jgi:hypothetical protein
VDQLPQVEAEPEEHEKGEPSAEDDTRMWELEAVERSDREPSSLLPPQVTLNMVVTRDGVRGGLLSSLLAVVEGRRSDSEGIGVEMDPGTTRRLVGGVLGSLIPNTAAEGFRVGEDG